MATGDSAFSDGFSKAFGVEVKGVPSENQRTTSGNVRSKTAGGNNKYKTTGS